jgi:hydrogenase nickel incorporation protein HypA/HybF
MHETSMSQSILRAVLAELRRIGPPAARLKRVRVVAAGGLHPVVPDDVISAYATEAQGTPAEGSVLELSIAPTMGRCTACGWRGEILDFACGSCGSLDLDLEGADAFRLDELEVEEADSAGP